MKDYQGSVEKLRKDAAEAALIRDLTADGAKREEFNRRHERLNRPADEVERATSRQTVCGRPMAGDLFTRDIDAEADEALEVARTMPSGQEKMEALKKAGVLRKAADAGGISFAKRGRPRK
jgi:hypothetical protein